MACTTWSAHLWARSLVLLLCRAGVEKTKHPLPHLKYRRVLTDLIALLIKQTKNTVPWVNYNLDVPGVWGTGIGSWESAKGESEGGGIETGDGPTPQWGEVADPDNSVVAGTSGAFLRFLRAPAPSVVAARFFWLVEAVEGAACGVFRMVEWASCSGRGNAGVYPIDWLTWK